MSLRTKIYTAYEKPDLAEPADRLVLVREGFSIWAFLFTVLWLISERLWLATIGYLALIVVIIQAGEQFGASPISLALAQLFVQLLLGFSAYDLKRWTLTRRGYHFTGIVTAENELNATRRYYDYSPQAAQ
jgi:hypothetical protein